MLILTRKLGERIYIGDDIIITLLEIKGSQVKLGIDAPKHVNIHRHEVYEKIIKANLESSDVLDVDLFKAATMLHGIGSERAPGSSRGRFPAHPSRGAPAGSERGFLRFGPPASSSPGAAARR